MSSLALVMIAIIWATAGTPQPEPMELSGERALSIAEELTTRGNRYYGAEKREASIAFLREQLDQRTDQTALQRFQATEQESGTEFSLVNVIGRIWPEKERRVVLGTHWDTRLWAEEDPTPSRRSDPIQGANDGTSGVAVLLEIASVIKTHEDIPYGVDIVFFDGEEFGRPGSGDYCQGSRHFADLLKSLYPRSRPELAVVIDMVGDCDQRFLPERSSLQKAPMVTERIWSSAEKLGYGAHFGREKAYGIEDDHTALQKAGIPAVLLIDYDYPYWHTHEDTIDKICARSLERVGEVLLQVLQEEVP